MRLKKYLSMLLAYAVLTLAGCASGPPVDPKKENVSLVFGYFDMSDARSNLKWVSLKRYATPPAYYNLGVKDGLFLHIGVEPGAYQVDTFGGTSGLFGGQIHEYNFGGQGRNDTAIRIDKPGVYFLGAYKYVHHDQGLLSPDKFSVQPIKSPSEKELLQRVITRMESSDKLKVYTRQIEMAKKRLAALR